MKRPADSLAAERRWLRRWERRLARAMARLDALWGLPPLQAAPAPAPALRKVWTESELQLLRELYPRTLSAEIAARLGLAVHQVHRKAHRLGLKKDRDVIVEWARDRSSDPAHPIHAAGFKPGHLSWNKGRKMSEGWSPGRMAETWFRKGQRPHTWMPIGSHRVNGDGYVDRKVSDTGHGPRDWVGVHRLVWMEAHGPVPEGHKVVFKPGRRTTDPELITLDALELLSHAELLQRNSIHRYPPEIVQAMQLRGTLVRAINRKAKES